MIFSYKELKNFLVTIKSNYSVTPFCECYFERGIILRHDVDMFLAPAYKMAEIEKECDIRSTFFIMVTNPFYNISDGDNKEKIRKMSDDGFEIALHFDPMVYKTSDKEKLQKKIDIEASIISEITGEKVKTISLHNPSVNNEYFEFEGYINAYSKKYFSKERYCSDSRQHFLKDPWTFIDFASEKLLQINLHPLHYSNDGDPYDKIVIRCVSDFANRLNRVFEVNNKFVAQASPLLIKFVQTGGFSCAGE